MPKPCEMLTLTARSPKGTKVGSQLTFPASNIPKRDIVAWAFGVAESYKNTEEAVGCFAKARSPFTLPALLTGSLALPKYLSSRPSFQFTGRTGSDGPSGNILKPQKFRVPSSYWVANVDGTSSTTVMHDTWDLLWDHSRTGVENLKWRSIIKSGGNATTPMSAQRGYLSGNPGTFVATYFRQGIDKRVNSMAFSGFRTFPGPVSLSIAGQENLYNTKALSKLYSRLWDLQHDARIGESLGEYRQAMLMIGKPLGGMRDLIGLYKRRTSEIARNAVRRVGRPLSRFDAENSRDLLRSLAALYLEFNFGWLPLAKDLQAALAAVDKVRGQFASVVNASYRSDDVYSDQTINDSQGGLNWTVRVLKKVKMTVRYKVGINVEKLVKNGDYLYRVGLTPREFVPTLYAVLPYSWLFDYFTNVNVLLESLTADTNFTTWTCKTVRKECVVETTSIPNVTLTKQSIPGCIDAGGTPSVTSSTLVTVVRSIPVNLIALPTLVMPKTAKPYFNMLALLARKKSGSAGVLVDPALGL